MTDFFTHHFNAGSRIEAQAGEVGEALEAQGLGQGRMISGNKACPKGHKCFFNACIFIREGGIFRRAFWERYRQVWWGDIDLTASHDALQAAANVCGHDLYVTRERYRWHGYHGEEDGVVRIRALKR